MAIIGTFSKTENGFIGTLHTLAIRAEVAFQKRTDKASDSHPDYDLHAADIKIGVAWERSNKKGRYISVVFDDPSFAPGFYSLSKGSGANDFFLTFERPRANKA